jgi:hypothetical protein
MKPKIAFALLALLLAGCAFASTDDRSYDDAVSCLALSKLAMTEKEKQDEKVKAALKLMEAEVDTEIGSGKTRSQADADIEYARFAYQDAWDEAAILAEWKKCLKRWSE